MMAVMASLVLSQASVSQPVTAPWVRVHLGAQVGLPLIAGVGVTSTFFKNGRPQFDADAWWEPSAYLQSYSVGGAWRPAGQFFFVGARLRWVQFQAPWTPGFRGAQDNHFGMGLETGVRVRVGPGDKGVIAIALGATYLPTQSVNLQLLLGLTAGFSWSVFER